MAQAIKRGDSELYLSAIPFEVKEVEGEERTLRFVGSDETPDRDNDIIEVNGWELANYRKNPVFLWAHDYRFPPIGRAKKVSKEDGKLVFDIEFPAEGIFPFADLIFNLYKNKFLRATSVGFIPKKYEVREDDDVKDLPEWRRGRRYKKQELLELSAVPVPSNPNALQMGLEKGYITEEQAEAVTDWMNGKIGCPTKACKAIEGAWKAEAAEGDDNMGDNKTGVKVALFKETPSFEGLLEELSKDPKAEYEAKIVVDEVRQLLALRQEDGLYKVFTWDFLKALDVEKAGAVLNRKNKERLKKAQELIQEVLNSAEPAEGEEEDGDKSALNALTVNLTAELTDELKNILEQIKQAAQGKQPDATQADDEIDLDAIDVQTDTADGEELDFEPETLKQLISEAVKEELDKACGKVS